MKFQNIQSSLSIRKRRTILACNFVDGNPEPKTGKKSKTKISMFHFEILIRILVGYPIQCKVYHPLGTTWYYIYRFTPESFNKSCSLIVISFPTGL